MLVYFSWILNKSKSLDHVPEKANLVLNCGTTIQQFASVRVIQMCETNYYKTPKNYINMEQENEREIRCDIEKKITNNLMRKHD